MHHTENVWASFCSINYIQHEAVFENNTSMLTSIIPLQHLGTVSLATKCVFFCTCFFFAAWYKWQLGEKSYASYDSMWTFRGSATRRLTKSNKYALFRSVISRKRETKLGESTVLPSPIALFFCHMWHLHSDQQRFRMQSYFFSPEKPKGSVLIGNVGHSTALLDLNEDKPTLKFNLDQNKAPLRH